MNTDLQREQNPIIYDDELYGTKIKSKPTPEVNVGMDLSDKFLNTLAYSGESSQVDISKLESFRQVSQSRDQVYDLIDTMANDPTIAAVLETYAEDATETNERGDIVWVEADDSEIGKYITYLLDSMEINKHIYKWVYSLCKYGDCYLRLYKESDFEDFLDLLDIKKDSRKLNEQLEKIKQDNIIESLTSTEEEKKKLEEDVVVKVYSKNDNFAHYVEMVPNPAEMYELTKFGKSYAYIKAPVISMSNRNNTVNEMYPTTFRYSYRIKDVEVFEPIMFVHACLTETDSRQPEEISIFLDNDLDSDSSYTFNVKRGQSVLYNTFKIWRELSLLENSLLLNRITRSSILRIIGVEVGDMPKENIQKHLMGIKQLIEQKSALDTNQSLNEYTNPGPMENNIYIPTHNGQGSITTQQVGGDVDVRGISDIDYFKDKLFSSLKVPKQYFGFTEDGAGFNGGQSLTIISSRYAKTIKRIQNTMIQALTDAVNLMLLDKGFDSYINKYTIRMQEPTTQEEIDRRDGMANKISVASDVMNLLSDIEDPVARLKILKCLLSNIISDGDIIQILQEQVDILEEQIAAENNPDMVDDMGGGHESMGMMNPSGADIDIDMDMGDNGGTDMGGGEEAPDMEMDTGDTLPLPADLGADFTDANMET